MFLVGGVVRDALMGLDHPSDVDLTTDAVPETIRALLEPHVDALWDQGARFGTIAAMVGEAKVEITTHRCERYDSGSRKPVVGFGTDIVEDLERRDFTINAMALDLIGELGLVDPFGGRSDLEQGRLRTPQEPSVSFGDDPLRMMRAARFVARFGLDVDAALTDAMAKCAPRMSIVSVERQRDEIEGLLGLPDVGAGLAMLTEAGLDEVVFSVSVSSLVGLDWAAIETVEHKRLVLFDSLGDVRQQMRHFRYANAAIVDAEAGAAVIEAITTHTGSWTDAEIRRVALGKSLRASAFAAMIARSSPTSDRARGEVFAAALADLRAREDLEDVSVPLSGRDVMDLLGIDEGAMIGEALDYLRECRIADGPIDRATAMKLLQAWTG